MESDEIEDSFELVSYFELTIFRSMYNKNVFTQDEYESIKHIVIDTEINNKINNIDMCRVEFILKEIGDEIGYLLSEYIRHNGVEKLKNSSTLELNTLILSLYVKECINVTFTEYKEYIATHFNFTINEGEGS